MKQSDPFVESIKNTLDQQSLEDETRQKLAKARRQALDSVELEKPVPYRPVILTFASITALAIAISLTLQHETPMVEVDNIETFEIITSRESLDLYQELEFYLWLEGKLPEES
ncbi:MAG: hypothetical protein GY806_17215 [Gammaproteobacteria bacterium]|nr:hypothetical protein [Gammaproteobacteria bacterium]